jgi:hypothetical protein
LKCPLRSLCVSFLISATPPLLFFPPRPPPPSPHCHPRRPAPPILNI